MPEDGKSYNTENLKGALDEILGANPNAKIIVRVRCYPPDWWMKKYPQDALQSIDGKVCDKIFPAWAARSLRVLEPTSRRLWARLSIFAKDTAATTLRGITRAGQIRANGFIPIPAIRIGWATSRRLSNPGANG